MCCNGFVSMRTVICWMLVGVITITLCLRSFISMSIVLMIRPEGVPVQDDDNYLDWPKNAKGIVLLMPLAGSFISMIFYMKFLADRRSPKVILAVIILTQSLLSLAGPITAKFSFFAFLVNRFCIGLGEGCLLASVHTIGGRWFPAEERTFKIAAYTCGFQIAFGIATYFVSFLNSIGLVWDYAFYIFGVFGLLFLIPFWIFVTDEPSENKFITKDEENYLYGMIHQPTKQKLPIPWKAMFTSVVVYTHIFCTLTALFAIGITSGFLPSYFDSELKISVTKSGWFTLLPFITQIVSKLAAGTVANFLIRKGIVTPTVSTKIWQAIGSFGSSIALLILPFCRNETLVLCTLALYGLTFSMGACGSYTSMTLIAPRFTGSVSAQIAVLGVIANLMPMVTYEILNTFDVANKYVYMFVIAAAVHALSGACYLIWGSAAEQPWAKTASVPLKNVTYEEETTQ